MRLASSQKQPRSVTTIPNHNLAMFRNTDSRTPVTHKVMGDHQCISNQEPTTPTASNNANGVLSNTIRDATRVMFPPRIMTPDTKSQKVRASSQINRAITRLPITSNRLPTTRLHQDQDRKDRWR